MALHAAANAYFRVLHEHVCRNMHGGIVFCLVVSECIYKSRPSRFVQSRPGPVPTGCDFGVSRLGRYSLRQTAKLHMAAKKVSFKMHPRTFSDTVRKSGVASARRSSDPKKTSV